MMRSWGNRADTSVVDEPFYAFYLKSTGKKHPGADEVIRVGTTDSADVVAQLSGPIPGGKRIYYQKQMTHHLLPEVGREWLGQVVNCFLIRDPAEVITSYIERNADPGLDDLGFRQQAEIFDLVAAARCAVRGSGIPPVIDAKDVLEDPRKTLCLLCDAIRIEFDEAMLSWPPGGRDTDGVWAKHWYGTVARSTSFAPYKPKNEPVPERLRDVYEKCREWYERLYQHRLH